MEPLQTAAATRQVQWDITPPMVWFMYVSLATAVAIFSYGIWQRLRLWRLGKPTMRLDRPGARLARVLLQGVGHAGLLKDRVPGVMHALIFAGFGILFAATLVVFIDFDLRIPIMHGRFYLYFQSLGVDVFGLLTMVGAGIAAWRRYVVHLPQLEQRRRVDAWLLASLAVLLATGFVLEGIRIAATADPWGRWSPVGYICALAVRALPLGPSAIRNAYRALWLFHVALWHAFVAAIPFTKMIHLVTSPLNIYFGNIGEARGITPPPAFEGEPATLGIRTALDMTWKQLLDLDACTECGRCEAACPAWAEGKPLSPKRVILDLRDHVHASAASIIGAKKALQKGDATTANAILDQMPPLAGGIIREETLWACTTCRACEEACPVAIEHVPLILQLRQHLAMEQARVPPALGEAVAGLEMRHHPFRGMVDRRSWYKGLPVREMQSTVSHEGMELLYWVGCAAVADERLARIARALVKVMTTAGVSFAVLGPEERCCGDPARRTGNDFHYDMLARANIETLGQYKVKTIVTHCPHCLQTLKHEYAQLGATYNVMHHTELIQRLIAEGRLPLARSLGDAVTFHDPCYLGRYNDVYEAPRQILDRLGLQRREMARSRSRSFCCGSGGGHAFFEDLSKGRIDRNRASEALATGADIVCTGCPFCLSMLEGAMNVRQGERPVRVRDIAEVIAEALGREEGASEPNGISSDRPPR